MRGCITREIDLGGKQEFRFECVCGGQSVGTITAFRRKISGRIRYVVGGVRVRKELRRAGIGTKLYEVAAREACRRRAPLASDERAPGAHSTAFWQKQLAKGRAIILSERGGAEGGRWAPIYSLSCPAPTSLKGRR